MSDPDFGNSHLVGAGDFRHRQGGCFTGTTPLRSALQTTLIGGLAAFGIARAISWPDSE